MPAPLGYVHYVPVFDLVIVLCHLQDSNAGGHRWQCEEAPCPVESPRTGLISRHAVALLNKYNQCL